MNKFSILFAVFILAASFALAAGDGSGGQGANPPGAEPSAQEIPAEQGAQGESGTIGSVASGGSDQEQGAEEGMPVETTTQTQQQNQGEATQIQNEIQTQNKIQSGSYATESGKQVQVQTMSNSKIQLQSGSISAQTSMEMLQEQVQDKTKLSVKLSNGKNSEVKVMPDTASEKALEQLRLKVCSAENGCQLELKEVGAGDQLRAAYEIQAQKQTKLLGLFKAKMQVQAQVDAENGEVIKTQKPWWAFLASESEE